MMHGGEEFLSLRRPLGSARRNAMIQKEAVGRLQEAEALFAMLGKLTMGMPNRNLFATVPVWLEAEAPREDTEA